MKTKNVWFWNVSGDQEHPTGYHDHLMYVGYSRWQAAKAVWAGLRNGMTVTIFRHRVRKWGAQL